MKKAVFVLLLVAYVAVVVPLAAYLRDRPVAIKLGYTPHAGVLKIVAADQRTLMAELSVLKVLFYYGTLVAKWRENVIIRPEYYNMFKTLESAVILDPYNMDAYYFAQAAFTWEIGRARDVNRLLEYGMQHRTWDWTLPFYAGFNAAFFLQEYQQAAGFMEKAAELSGSSHFTNLAARFFYESGRNSLGVMFLERMIENARDEKIKNMYRMRRDALLAVSRIEGALERYRTRFGRSPEQLAELVSSGAIREMPRDPYGGRFFLDDDGKVRSTSAFCLAGSRAEEKDRPASARPRAGELP
jgi:tetratricopeptide (TPR) repeat protein